uniref:Doublecortin domain-containing protein n=1 Tax=Latimeria chalumnae TaxID=7897 RepID=H3ALV2_LATCH
ASSESATASRLRQPESPQSKKVLVYCNGDPFFPGKNFVITSRYVATFDSFLSELTQRIDPPFGAVRSLYTPEEGHRVWDLASLQHRAVYVAAGTEGFKKLEFQDLRRNKWSVLDLPNPASEKR